jgi:hypothetical protein
MAKQKNSKVRLATKTYVRICNTVKPLIDQFIVDGLSQYTVEGIIEAKWKIAGIANLLLRIGERNLLQRCIQEVNRLDSLLKVETLRAEVWQNLKETLEQEKKDA